tara:strand:- start:860 stop:1207 length:348 start_codon:yes stop_codon:yes gene_type:complete
MSGHHPPAPETLMELDSVMMLIERIGLPAVIIGACFYYIVKTQQAHQKEIERWENKDTLGDERLIDVINKQNERSEHVAQALNDLTVTNKDVAKTNERLASEIKGMAEALMARRR